MLSFKTIKINKTKVISIHISYGMRKQMNTLSFIKKKQMNILLII